METREKNSKAEEKTQENQQTQNMAIIVTVILEDSEILEVIQEEDKKVEEMQTGEETKIIGQQVGIQA